MKLKDFYPTYLVTVGVLAGHYAPGWQAFLILFLGLGGWIFYFEPRQSS